MRRPELGATAGPRRRSAGSGLLLTLATAGLLVAGCSAGQEAQTAKELPTNDAASADVGSLSLRDMTLAYPSRGRYARGDNVRLDMVIINNDLMTADALVEVRTDTAERVVVSPAEVEISPDSAVSFRGSRPSVTLVRLTRSMWPGQDIQVTFRFARAGAVTATVAVAVPITPVPPAPTAEPSTTPGADPA
jgi:periplasmic copper chaperone A